MSASAPRAAARQVDSWMALELVNALLCLASECMCMLTGWDESSAPCAQEYRKSSHPNWRKAEILVQPNKKLFAAYQNNFCDTLSSHLVLSWKWQVNVCFALTLKLSLLGCMNSYLTEFLILPNLLCVKQQQKRKQKNHTHTFKKLLIFTEVCEVEPCLPPKELSVPPYEGVQRHLGWLVWMFCSSLDIIQP